MLIEIYNEQGIRVLDNETKVMKSVQRLTVPNGQTFWYSNRNLPNSWYSDYNIASPTGISSYTEFAINPIYTGTTVNLSSSLRWVRPKHGTSVASSNRALGIGMYSSANQTILGEGVEFAYTKPTVANDASGFIDCYSPSGELVWSLTSLINAPQIVKIIDFPTTTVFDLNTIDEAKRDKTFFYPVYDGEYDVIDDSTAVFKSLIISRVNNLVYFRGFGSNTVTCKVFVAYIP